MKETTACPFLYYPLRNLERIFRRLAPAIVFLLLCLPFGAAQAAQLKAARVSQVIRDVKLLPQQAAPRPASIRDEVREGTAVRTGIESRAELTFTDETLARLGANTIFSFDQGTRNLELGGGAMLLRVPKNAGGAQINTAAITAAITGTTIMLEYHPDAYIKFVVLEGTGRIFRNNRVGESVLLKAGQMLIVNPKGTSLPEPVDVDLGRLMKTSALLSGDFAPLPSLNLIAQEIKVQEQAKTEQALLDTNLVIFGGGTTVTLTKLAAVDQRAAVMQTTGDNSSSEPTPTPTATPSSTPTPTVTPTPTSTPTPTVTLPQQSRRLRQLLPLPPSPPPQQSHPPPPSRRRRPPRLRRRLPPRRPSPPLPQSLPRLRSPRPQPSHPEPYGDSVPNCHAHSYHHSATRKHCHLQRRHRQLE